VRILDAILLAQSLFVASLFVAAGQSEFCFCGCVGTKPIGDKNFRREALLLEHFRKSFTAAVLSRRRWTRKSRTSPSSSTARHRSADPRSRAPFRPDATAPSASTSYYATLESELRSKLRNPPPHRFIGDVEAALGEQVLDVSETEPEAEIEPNGVLDHRRRILVTGT
jgi:hypothetical protein